MDQEEVLELQRKQRREIFLWCMSLQLDKKPFKLFLLFIGLTNIMILVMLIVEILLGILVDAFLADLIYYYFIMPENIELGSRRKISWFLYFTSSFFEINYFL